MQQFDICRMRGSQADSFVVLLQHNEASHLNTCIVAPLVVLKEPEKTPKIRPPIDFNGKTLFLLTDRLAAVTRGSIETIVGTARADQGAIKNAIDRLFLGF